MNKRFSLFNTFCLQLIKSYEPAKIYFEIKVFNCLNSYCIAVSNRVTLHSSL